MSIRLGNNPVVKLSIGAQIISMVYVGTNIVYSGEWTPFELFAANEPGVWYDPSDIELDWRRNLLTNTDSFASYSLYGVTRTYPAAGQVAPNGKDAVSLFTETATTGFHEAASGWATSGANRRFVYSVYAKYNGAHLLLMFSIGTSGEYANFDLQNGVVGRASANANANIEDVGNGWFRVSVSPILPVSGTLWLQLQRSPAAGRNTGYAGDGASGVYVWGVQFEEGTAATPYQRITDGIQDYFVADPQPVLFQDAAGTIPVTAVEQPVGLILDKSKGLVLGPELMTNGDFSNGTTGWIGTNASLSVVNGCLRLTGTGGTFARARTNFSGLVVGRSYKFSVTCVSEGVGANAGFATGSGFSDSTFRTMNQGQTLELIATATATAGSVVVYLTTTADGSGITADYDNISVRELPGNHAYQTTATSRPVLSARYNLWTNTETLATQSRTVRAAKHIISFSGTGTVTLSGAFSGSLVGTGVNDRVYLEFTTTAGTLTATVSGSVTKAQLEEV